MKEKLRHYSHHVSRFFRTKIFWASATALVLVGGLFLTYALIPSPSLSDGFALDETRKLSAGAPFTFHFSQAMDQASVESSFSMNPTIEGRFEWPDSKTLQFVPSQSLSIGEQYLVTIGAKSRNWALKELQIDTRNTFVISGPPTVKFISPYLEPQVTETEPVGFVQGLVVTAISDFLIIHPHQAVTVMFDRPMRALTALDEQPTTPLIEITPPVKGTYRWIGTTAFQFVPEEWTMGTVYTLKLPKGIVSLDGSSTQDETVWTLATEAPVILETKPVGGSDVFPISGAIELTFNQPMELDYVKPSANILLYPSNDAEVKGGGKNDGFFNTEVVFGKDATGKVDRRILVFKPEFKYQYDTAYKLVVKAGLAGAAAKMGQGYGARPLESDYELNFKTTKLPGIASIAPKSGEQNFEGGTIILDFDSPMTKELVAAAAELSPKAEKDPEIYVVDEGRHVELWYPLKPSTSYSFSLKAPFKDAIGNTAQKGIKTFFKTAPLKANVNLLIRNNFGLFTKGLVPTYPVRVLNATTLNLALCPVSEQEFFQTTKNYRWYDYRCPRPQTATVDIQGALNESKVLNLNLKEIFGQDFGSGFYFFEATSPQYLDYGTQPPRPVRLTQTFMVSDTALTLKRSGQDLLVWATDLVTGKPVSRMDLKVVSEGGDELLTGVTDGNGTFKITKDLSENVFVIGRKTLEKEDRWAVAGQYWDEGIQSWQFNANGQWISLDEPRIYLYTERPLYRPGDEIFFKGIYRLDHDAELSLPKDRVVTVVLQDPDYNDSDKKTVPVLADGSFNGSLKLSDKARLGQFGLYAETAGKDYPQRFYTNFFVEEYKKPKFKVELLLPKTDLVLGDKIPVDVVAGYYFGGAIQGGKLHWSLMRDSTYFDRYKGQDFFSFGVWEMFECFWSRCGAQDSRIVAEGDGVLDSNGRLHLELPTDQEATPGVSYLYTLNVEIQNKDGEFVTARDSVVVHQANTYVGLGIKNYIVQPKESALVKVITVSNDGTLVSGKRVTLELFLEEWNVVKKQGVDGSFYDESVRTLKSINKKSVTTGAEPVEASFDINEGMEGGRYVVQGTSMDNGRQTLSETNFYVSSESWVEWGGTNNNRMTLVADKPEYFVGGKARVLIQSPFGTKDSPAKGLVTTERGTLRSYEVIDITSNSQTIEIPIKDTMAPNIYVSVLVMKDASASFKEFTGYDAWQSLRGLQSSLNTSIDRLKGEIATLQADTDAKSVNRNAILISKKRVEMEKLGAELLDTMESLKSTQDQEPKEVAYELAKPDFRMGVVNLRVNRREHEIQIDLKSTKPDYRAGETAEIEIRTRDYQNRPVRSTLSLAVVDESLLALKANTNQNPIDYFLGARALQVSTSSNLTLHVDRVNVGAGKGSKGGDGGGAAEGANRKRGDFKDTAYYNPLIQTDDGGFAKVSFQVPDNLTTWQVWAVASAAKDKFGMAKEDFVVKKPLSLSSILPRFVVSGDALNVGVLVHNQSGKDQTVSVELAAEGLNLDASPKQSVSVKDGASATALWPVRVKPIARDMDLTVEFRSAEDTLRMILPAKTFAYPEVVAANGITDAQQTEKVRIPAFAVPDMGELSLSAGASLVTQFLKEFKALFNYPYGCAEQLVSKIFPPLVVQLNFSKELHADFYKLMGLDPDQNAAMITDTLQRLSKFQHYDGGYGFWEGSDKSYPILTAYIAWAQTLANRATFTVSQNDHDLALQYLWNALNSTDPNLKLSLSERAFIVWVLSESGQLDTGMALQLYDQRDGLPLYSKGLLLMNLHNLEKAGQKTMRSLIERLKAEIVSEQIISDRSIHFEEAKVDPWDLNTNRRTTAILLMALDRDDPENPILPNIVNYLTHSKTDKMLTNTQETAWTLMAILQYAQNHGEFGSDYQFTVKVNGDKALEGAVDAKNLFEVFNTSMPLSSFTSGDSLNTIDFQKNGTGQLLYDMQLRYYLPNETVQPMEHGFFMERAYYPFSTGDTTTATTTFKTGELYRGELQLIVPEDMHFAVVEERLPAGFEAINFNLDTSDTSLQAKLDEITRKEVQGENYWIDNPLWNFNHIEQRDDRVLLFADNLPKGVYTYSFLVRAGLPGKYHHLPASATEMYFPEVFGRTSGEWVEIKE